MFDLTKSNSMKNYSNLTTGFLAASCLFLLISANTKQTPAEEITRYHMAVGGYGTCFYDAVTGKYKVLGPSEVGKVGKVGNIKEMLSVE